MNPLDERFPTAPSDFDGDGHARVVLRYEDVTRDGRIALNALPNGVGEAVWRASLAHHPARESLRRQGVVPILSRFVIQGSPGPFSVDPSLEAHGRYQFAHSVDANDNVDRLYLNMWVDLDGKRGRTWDPQPDGDGERIFAGRVFAEHVLTRLFAPPELRRVRSLEAQDSMPAVPRVRYVPRSFPSIATMPAGARALEPHLRIEAPTVTFGLVHTDSNQHVNSLVYPQMFEEFAIRRLAALGVRTPLLARSLEVGYRKPCFVGDRMIVAMQTYEHEGAYGAFGFFANADDSPDGASLDRARAHAYVWMSLEP